MQHEDMDRLIHTHITAEMDGDTAGAVAVYTDDVVHDVVGFPSGPAHGKAAAQGFYDFLVENFHTEAMVPTRTYYGDDFCVVEHDCTATVPGEFLGVPGNGRRITFRMVHVFEFRQGLISREQVWLDSGSVIGQLTTPEVATVSA
jgi:steroid delta-isomerase-like uncharacterized protein